MHIYDDFVDSFFVAIYSVFESRRERAAGTLFLSVSLERNTLPLTGASGWWVVAGGWWLAGWLLVAGYGSLVSIIYIYIYIYVSVFAIYIVHITAGFSTAASPW